MPGRKRPAQQKPAHAATEGCHKVCRACTAVLPSAHWVSHVSCSVMHSANERCSQERAVCRTWTDPTPAAAGYSLELSLQPTAAQLASHKSTASCLSCARACITEAAASRLTHELISKKQDASLERTVGALEPRHPVSPKPCCNDAATGHSICRAVHDVTRHAAWLHVCHPAALLPRSPRVSWVCSRAAGEGLAGQR